MMQQKMPWEEDWSQPQDASPGGYQTITIPRDPRQVRREDEIDRRATDAAARDATRFNERNQPTLPAGYAWSPDHKTAVRIPGLPLENGAQGQPSDADRAAVRAEALDKIRLARSLQQRSRDGWFTTGFGAGIAGSIGGTPAYDVRQDTETLKNAGALTRIMEMARTNGGKNPLTPLSNSDFQALASSLSNLDTGQSDAQYQANVQRVIDLYSRAYQTAGGTDLEGDLDPSKRRRKDAAPVVGLAGQPPSSGGPTISAPVYGDGSGGSTPTLATGAYKTERDPARAGVNARVAGMLRSGAPDQAIRDYLAKSGANADPASVDAVLEFRRRNPTYRGGYSVDLESRQVPTTAWNRFAASPTGTGIYAAVDAGLGGLSDEIASGLGGGDLADLNARKQAAFATNPNAAFTGQVLGTIGSMAGLGALSRTTGLASRFTNPQLWSDVGFGAVSGAGQSNDNRLLGGTFGAAGGFGGNILGNAAASGIGMLARTQPGMAVTNATRGMFGRPLVVDARPLTGADRTAYNAINRAGIDNITSSLTDAQQLGVPMSLADTSPNLSNLAGAAVRRSPTAASYAEDTLLPRSMGQIDRLTTAMDRNFGPVANIPQRSADLIAQARAAADGLYDRAYSNPVPSTPELEALLNTPFGRQALARARTIAANERRPPEELGFALNEDGSVVLNPQPNDLIAQHIGARAELDAAQKAYKAEPSAAARDRVMAARENLRQARRALDAAPDPSVAASVPAYTAQTLDYVKRGMDDVLEQYRNPITGKLALDEAGRAQNQVRGKLLDEVDLLNPDYAAARAAYAGPAGEREAFQQGTQALSLSPDQMRFNIAGLTPERLDQYRLGYRSGLQDRAENVRFSSNPFEPIAGSPAAQERLSILWPEGTPDFVKQYGMERQLARTTNDILGNSKTAQRTIADQDFAGSNLAPLAIDAGLAAAGQIPLATVARNIGTRSLGDYVKFGVGKRAEEKAGLLTPILLNTNPSEALAKALDLIARQRAWDDLVTRTTPRLGMFGRSVGSQAAVVPFNR